MASAELRLYAELNDFLPRERHQRPFEVTFDGMPAVKDLIESAGVPHTEVDLVLINGTPVAFARKVADGDRISVFPVFEAFDVGEVSLVREEPLRQPRFLLDVHLGKLERHLRLLGFDAERGEVDDAALARTSRNEHRTLLTRDLGLLKRSEVTHGYFVRSQMALEQLREVVDRFQLARRIDPFSRCLVCNGALSTLAPELARARVPPRVAEWHNEYRGCDRCGRIFWPGTHHARLAEIVALFSSPWP